jgi:cell division protein FtsQ
VLTERVAVLALAADEAAVAIGFGVQEVYVSGRRETASDDLIAALDVAIGDPLPFLDLEGRRARVAALPWVGGVVVERRLPGILVVHLTEKRPMALWQNDGEVRVIDRNGGVIAGVDPRRFADLPLVVGPDAPAHAAELLAILASEPAYARRVDAAIRIAGRRWDVRLDNGVTIALPAEGAGSAWSRLVEADAATSLLQREVETIDLRLPDRMFLRLTPEGLEALGAPEAVESGEST